MIFAKKKKQVHSGDAGKTLMEPRSTNDNQLASLTCKILNNVLVTPVSDVQ